jgi:DNA-binding response OmpR family regulator
MSEPTAAPQPSAPQPKSEPQTSAQDGKPRRLLLVEDDDALANTYTMRLEAEGFQLKRVANGEDALVTALDFQPELVLLDVMMPKVSGFEVLDILRNTPDTANVKIIMLTALSQESDRQRAMDMGADEYLVKSQVVIAEVVEHVKHQLGMG